MFTYNYIKQQNFKLSNQAKTTYLSGYFRRNIFKQYNQYYAKGNSG